MIDHGPEGLPTGCWNGLGKTRFGGFFVVGQKIPATIRFASS